MRPFSSAPAESAPPTQGFDRGMRAAWLILLLALSATLLAWMLERQAVDAAAAARFQTRSRDLVQAIAARMATYEQVLHGAVGLLRASQKVSFLEWRAYAETLDLEARNPGIVAIGYAPYVRHTALPGFLRDLSAQPTPRFELRPPGTREVYVPVTYIEPFDASNRRAFGYDMHTEANRRAAIDRAGDSGEAVLTAPVILQQEEEHQTSPGVVMYLPYYEGAPQTVEQRRAGLAGLVFAHFRVSDLMQGILGDSLGPVRLALYDGADADPAHRIYDSLPGKELPRDCIRRSQHAIIVATRPWTIVTCNQTTLADPDDLAIQHIILGTGVVISLLLFGITWSLANTRTRALRMATLMTQELREERTRLAEIAAALGEGLFVQDTRGIITYSNPAAGELLGWEADALVGRNSAELLSPEARPTGIGTHAHAEERERSGAHRYAPEQTQFQRRDGITLPVSVISTVIRRNEQPVGSVVAFLDVSEQRRAEAALREAQQFTALVQYSRDLFFLLDLQGRIMNANRVALESLGYARDELVGSNADKFVRWSTVPQPGRSFAALFESLDEGSTVRGEAEYIRKNGSSFFVEAAFSPVVQENNRVFLVSARDISERKEAERRIQRALDDLERSRREIEDANRRLADSNRELQRMSRRDGLTAIANRRSFDEYLDQEWNRAARDRRPLSLLMIDVDHFKAYNDRYGHPAGDDCLRQLAETIDRRLSRSIDIVARYGGEEFAVVLPETPLAGAVNIGERLRQAVEALALPHEASPVSDRVTISVGAATVIPHPGEFKEKLLSAADSALYRAKHTGRNRVCTAPKQEP